MNTVHLRRGEFITSQLKLAEAWGWNRETVKSFLGLLQSSNQIGYKSSNKDTIIFLRRWDEYQGSNPATNPAPKRHQFRQQGDNKTSTINNDKNDNNEKNDKRGTIHAALPVATLPPKLPLHTQFIEKFSDLYQEKTSQPFKADKADYVIAERLIKHYGLEAVIQKAMILAAHCHKADKWFTKKDGWAAFTIEKLSKFWNELIPQIRMSDQEQKDAALRAKVAEQEVHDVRVKAAIDAG
jgi:hypothetical protein